MASGPITSWQIDGERMETVTDYIFLGCKITADGDWNCEIKRCLLLGRKSMTDLESILKSRDITLPTKVGIVKAMVFPVVMYGYESWTINKAEHRSTEAFKVWCWRRLLEVAWTARRSKRVNPKGNQSWVIIVRTDDDAEASVLWSPDAKSWVTRKDPDAGKDLRQEKKVMTEDEMVGWYHWLNGHEFEQAPGVGVGQGCLSCCRSCDRKELEKTEQLNWTEENEVSENVQKQMLIHIIKLWINLMGIQ